MEELSNVSGSRWHECGHGTASQCCHTVQHPHTQADFQNPQLLKLVECSEVCKMPLPHSKPDHVGRVLGAEKAGAHTDGPRARPGISEWQSRGEPRGPMSTSLRPSQVFLSAQNWCHSSPFLGYRFSLCPFSIAVTEYCRLGNS